MRLPFHLVVPLVLLAWVSSTAAGGDDKIKKAARGVLAKYDGAVVCVKIAGASYFIADAKPGPKADFSAELAGTVLTANGLTAICNFSSDFESLGVSILPAGAGADVAPTKQIYEFTSVKLVLKDGREVAAHLVMRDEKLGVAFVAPKQRDMKLTLLLMEKGPIPEVLDEVIVLNRLGEPLKRAPEIGITPVTALIKQPQALVIAGLNDGGCAVFDSSGRPLGVAVLRRAREQKGVPLESPMSAVTLTAETLLPAMANATKKWEEKGK